DNGQQLGFKRVELSSHVQERNVHRIEDKSKPLSPEAKYGSLLPSLLKRRKNVLHLVAAELAGQRAHHFGLMRFNGKALRAQGVISGPDALAELELAIHFGNDILDVRPELLDIIGLIFFQQQREEHFVIQRVAGFERVPASSDD